MSVGVQFADRFIATSSSLLKEPGRIPPPEDVRLCIARVATASVVLYGACGPWKYRYRIFRIWPPAVVVGSYGRQGIGLALLRVEGDKSQRMASVSESQAGCGAILRMFDAAP